jgi:hypothetical protein
MVAAKRDGSRDMTLSGSLIQADAIHRRRALFCASLLWRSAGLDLARATAALLGAKNSRRALVFVLDKTHDHPSFCEQPQRRRPPLAAEALKASTIPG